MLSPLHSFADRMINFDVYRNSVLLYTVPGLKNIENNTNKRMVEFFPEITIQVGDLLVNSGINYYVVDVDTQNSIIGNQQSAIINNSNFDVDNLKELIDLYGNNDKQQLYELCSLLEQSLQKDDFHKSKLSKFSDLIAKHSWLPTAIAQIISAYLQSH